MTRLSFFPYWSIEPAACQELLNQLRLRGSHAGPRPETEANAEARTRSIELPVQVRDRVAVIQIQGLMTKNSDWLTEWFGGTATSSVRLAVQAAAADESVTAILLLVDSPGGTVDGLAELADAIFQARQAKPVIAQVCGLCASAAYYAASQATSIHAHRMDMVGSIGTRYLLYDWSEAFAEAGIEAVAIDTGKYKSAGAMGTAITEDHRAEFQRIVDEYFADFVAAIVRGRGLDEKVVRESADGRVWIGADAVRRKLIDGIQTLDQTLAELTGQDTDDQRKAHHSIDLRRRRTRLREVAG